MVVESHSDRSQSQFPSGFRVLVVDDDIISLRVVEALLLRSGYKVTATMHPLTALEVLRESKNSYDIVISDVWMPELNGFKLLEAIGLEMNVPVIMLSADSDVKTVMKVVTHGAVDFMLKPLRLEDLRLIWKHVVRKSLHDTKVANNHGDKHNHKKEFEENHEEELEDDAKRFMRKRRSQTKEEYVENKESSSDNSSTHKKPRLTWSSELHARFLNAVHQLGIDRAVPKNIHDMMNIPGLTRENIASHLQKYRQAIKQNGVGMKRQYHGGLGPNGSGGILQSSVLPSLSQQLLSNVNTLGGHKSRLRRQQFRYASNPSVVGTSNTQSEIKGSGSQSLTSTPNQVDGSMQNSSFSPCASSGHPELSSGFKPQPVDKGMQIIGGDSLDLQSCPDGKKELAKHPTENSPDQTVFDLHKCGSVDDFYTFLKQFQQ